MYYKLVDKKPIECTFEQWCRFFEYEDNRRIALNEFNDWFVSTVFLGLSMYNPPLLFETMVGCNNPGDILGCSFADYQQRYETYNEAVEGHDATVKAIQIGAGYEKVNK